jgi:hypothetical protein
MVACNHFKTQNVGEDTLERYPIDICVDMYALYTCICMNYMHDVCIICIVYMDLYAHMYEYYVRAHVCILYAHRYAYACMIYALYTCICMHYIRAYVCIMCNIYTRLGVSRNTHACMHACMHTYMHAYIHTYIHTYT